MPNLRKNISGEGLDPNEFVSITGDTMTGDLRGTDFIATRSITLNRDGSGRISSVIKTNGRTINYTRDDDGLLESWEDGINDWSLVREDGFISQINVTNI